MITTFASFITLLSYTINLVGHALAPVIDFVLLFFYLLLISGLFAPKEKDGK